MAGTATGLHFNRTGDRPMTTKSQQLSLPVFSRNITVATRISPVTLFHAQSYVNVDLTTEWEKTPQAHNLVLSLKDATYLRDQLTKQLDIANGNTYGVA